LTISKTNGSGGCNVFDGFNYEWVVQITDYYISSERLVREHNQIIATLVSPNP